MTKNKFLMCLIMLAILVWAGYNISKLFTNKNTRDDFTHEVQKLYKTATKQYKSDKLSGDGTKVYLNNLEYEDVNNAKGLNIRGNSGLGFLVIFNDNDEMTYLRAVGNKKEMELGSRNGDEVVEYEDIVDSKITKKDSGVVVNFEVIEKSEYSGVISRGYRTSKENDGYYLTIYEGKCYGDGDISVSGILNNNGSYIVSVDSTYDYLALSVDIKTPSLIIKLDSEPSTLLITNQAKHLTYSRLSNKEIDNETDTQTQNGVVLNEEELRRIIVCEAGEYLETKSYNCAKCPVNTFSKKGEDVCSQCPSGTCAPVGSTSLDACTPC